MATSTRPSRDKVRAHRERLRQQGLRPIQIWVPDVRSPAFKAEAHRQSLAVAQSQQRTRMLNSPFARLFAKTRRYCRARLPPPRN